MEAFNALDLELLLKMRVPADSRRRHHGTKTIALRCGRDQIEV
jgi:hypothetical protein